MTSSGVVPRIFFGLALVRSYTMDQTYHRASQVAGE